MDMFSTFWKRAYDAASDVVSVLVPAVHPHVDMALFLILGAIFSHGYTYLQWLHACLSCISNCCCHSTSIPESMLIA